MNIPRNHSGNAALFAFRIASLWCWLWCTTGLAQVSYPPARYHVGDLFFADSTHGWVLATDNARTTLFRTADGGDTWSRIDAKVPFYKLFFLDSKRGWAISATISQEGDSSLHLYGSSDAGTTWSYLSSFSSHTSNRSDIITDFRFVDAEEGWFVGEGSLGMGIAFHTRDGGSSLEEIPAISGKKSLSRVYTLGSDRLWIFGNNIIFASCDHGRTWISSCGSCRCSTSCHASAIAENTSSPLTPSRMVNLRLLCQDIRRIAEQVLIGL